MKVTCSNKPLVQYILKLCYNFNIKHIIISPGSRNAPLTISFTNNSDFSCYSIPDERSAAFYALGMAKKLNKPVAIISTSGTAALNYAPAIAEAYYQEIPLIAITADRPPEWIDQEDGQTIRQTNIYNNFINYSANLPLGNNYEEIRLGKSEIDKAFTYCIANKKGPVHINIPFKEPLYDFEDVEIANNQLSESINEKGTDIDYDNILAAWNNSKKIMIIAGVLPPNRNLNKIITELIEKKNVVVIAPSYSNLYHDKIISIPELIFNTISDDDKKEFQPDLLISIGGPVVSKATKLFLRQHKAMQHFDIDFNESRIDTYLSLTDKIISSPSQALSYVNKNGQKKAPKYLDEFLSVQTIKIENRDKIIHDFKFSDSHIFEHILKTDKDIDLHFSNSTPIRYAELFQKSIASEIYCNRGTSGIDGNTSIAAGFALHNKKQTVLISGDISFGYDSNAFWNNHVPHNLKVVIINNGGGNIFSIINGPQKSGSLPYFETQIKKDTEKLCESYGVEYLSASSLSDFKTKYSDLLAKKKCTVLEIFTDGNLSAENYKQLFQELRL